MKIPNFSVSAFFHGGHIENGRFDPYLHRNATGKNHDIGGYWLWIPDNTTPYKYKHHTSQDHLNEVVGKFRKGMAISVVVATQNSVQLWSVTNTGLYFDGLMQERCNSIVNALELRLSCTNPSIWSHNALICNKQSKMPTEKCILYVVAHYFWADSRFASSQWETALLCNTVSNWVHASTESTLLFDWGGGKVGYK